MGKSKHESLSSLDKSSFQVIKGKLKEGKKKSGSAEPPNENEKAPEKEEKEKQKFWRKCLNFVRKHSLTHQRDKCLKLTKSLSTGGDENSTTEPEEAKAVQEYSDAIENISREFRVNTSTCDIQVEEKRLTETIQKEITVDAVLTSELYVRQDMENLVESGVFFDPNLTRDLTQSGELSQKSIMLNKRKLSFKVIDERSEDTIKTTKTVSEPSWNERKRILQHQRLQENINNLLEQFLFLEAEDTLDLSLSQNKLPEGRKVMEFEKPSRVSRELSREVSPEILVNIKPFKEPVSDDFMHLETFSTKLVLNEDTKQGSSKASMKFEFASSHPRIKSDVEDTPIEADTESLVSEKELNSTCFGEYAELVPETNNDDEPLEPPTCTVWGVYKSYSSCNAEKKQRRGSKQNVLDDLLDTLDDGNHESVFQRNLSQFRKKINVLPLSDSKKSAVKRKPEQKMMQKSENALRPDKVYTKKVAGFSESSPETRKRKNVGKFRIENLKISSSGKRIEKILENFYLLLSEPRLVCRTLGIKMETSWMNLSESSKELHSVTEWNKATLTKVEAPMVFNENVRNPMGIPSVSEAKTVPKLDLSEFVRRIPESRVTGSYSFHGIPFSLQIKSEAEIGKLTSGSGTFLDNLKLKLPNKFSGGPGPRKKKKKNFLKFLATTYETTHQVIQILNDSNCYVALIYDKLIPCPIPCAQSHSEPDVPKESVVSTETAFVNSTTLESSDSTHSLNTRNIENIHSLNEIQVESSLQIEVNEDKEQREAEERPKSTHEVELQGSLERRLSKILKHKSNSSPRESIVRSEFVQDSRPRRSSKEPDNRKRVLFVDKSMSLESQTDTVENKNRLKDPHQGLRPPEELKQTEGDQNKRQKTFVLDKLGTNVREEMAAAFNTIKEMKNWKKDPKGGNKRMSMVIMVSKK